MAVGAVIIVVVAIVLSKRRAHHMGEVTPSSAEVTGAISPAVEGASAPAVEGASAVSDVTGVTAKEDVEDHATAVKRPD